MSSAAGEQLPLYEEEEPCERCGALPSTFREACPYEPPHEHPHTLGERPSSCIAYDPDRSPIPF